MALASTVLVVGLADQENISTHQFCFDSSIPQNLLAAYKRFQEEISNVGFGKVGDESWNEMQILMMEERILDS